MVADYVADSGKCKNIAIKEISGDGSVIIASAYVADNPAVIFWKGGEVGIIYGPDKENPAGFHQHPTPRNQQ